VDFDLAFQSIHSRINIDSAIFTFGLLKNSGKYGYRVHCAGSDSYNVDVVNPLNLNALKELIGALEKLGPGSSIATIKPRVGVVTTVKLRFKGYCEPEGFKVKTSISGFLLFSMHSFTSSYCSKSDILRLIVNLKKCYE
jgi:hypothetical protein